MSISSVKTKNRILSVLCFLIIGGLFLVITYFSNTVLDAYDVTGVRPSAAFNPVLGIAFGWPAILACGIANFISDLISGWGIQVALLGIVPQILYGAIPYYVWKYFNHSLSKRTRLDSPEKTIMFAALMLVDSVMIGLAVGGIQHFVSRDNFFETALFAFLNDFDMCMVIGLPMMAIIDFVYSRVLHSGRRKLSVNEKIILIASALGVANFVVAAAVENIVHAGMERELLWPRIFEYSTTVFNILLIVSVGIMYACHTYKVRHAGLRIFEKPNGTIYVDEEKRLEFISYPGRAVEDRIKFGWTGKEIFLRKSKPSYEDSWCTMLSNQKGCPMKCSFCDVPDYGFFGNITRADLVYQMRTILDTIESTHTKMFEVNFMRMGEPSLNTDILKFIEFDLKQEISRSVNADVIFPALSTMLPKAGKNLSEYLKDYCRIKNEVYDGDAALQFSINTTDDRIRDEMFRNRSLHLDEIAEIAKELPYPKGIKYALNFVVAQDSVIDPKRIDELFDKEKFCIKMTPLHETFNAKDNGFRLADVYEKHDVFETIEDGFKELGWEVMIHMDRKEDDDDLLTCGNLLLSNISGNM